MGFKIFDLVTLTLKIDLLLKKINPDHSFWPEEEELSYLCPPSLHMSVSMSVCRPVGRMSVSLNLVQLITQERFAPEASNLVGR